MDMSFEQEYEGRKGGPYVSHDDPLAVGRFRDLVKKYRAKYPDIDMELMLELLDTHVVKDDDMRRVIIKAFVVTTINYFDKHPEQIQTSAENTKAAETKSETVAEEAPAKPYKSRKKKSAAEMDDDKKVDELLLYRLQLSYTMADGKAMGEHTSGEALDHSAVCHEWLQKIVARFGRDVILNTLSDDDVLAALRSQ